MFPLVVSLLFDSRAMGLSRRWLVAAVVVAALGAWLFRRLRGIARRRAYRILNIDAASPDVRADAKALAASLFGSAGVDDGAPLVAVAVEDIATGRGVGHGLLKPGWQDAAFRDAVDETIRRRRAGETPAALLEWWTAQPPSSYGSRRRARVVAVRADDPAAPAAAVPTAAEAFSPSLVVAEAERAHAAGRRFAFRRAATSAELAALAVAPAHRSAGLGRAVVYVLAAVAAAPAGPDGGLAVRELQGSAAEPSLVPWYRQLAQPLSAAEAGEFIVIDLAVPAARSATLEAATTRLARGIVVDPELARAYLPQ